MGLKLLVDILKVRQRFGWRFDREQWGKKFLLQFLFA